MSKSLIFECLNFFFQAVEHATNQLPTMMNDLIDENGTKTRGTGAKGL